MILGASSLPIELAVLSLYAALPARARTAAGERWPGASAAIATPTGSISLLPRGARAVGATKIRSWNFLALVEFHLDAHNAAGMGREIPMHARSALWLLLSVLALPWTAPQSASAAPRHSLDFEPVFSGSIGSFDASLWGDYVFRNESSWCRFWREAFSAISPPPACPAVDFRHEVVIASVLMQCGCDSFQIESVERVGSRRAVDVLVKHLSPGPSQNCVCVASCSAVGRAVVVAKPIGNVEFVRENVELSCSR